MKLKAAKKDSLKVLMAQLPVPAFTLSKAWDNLPLAAGCLTSMVKKYAWAGRLEIEILDMVNCNLSADARMIDLISAKAPDVLCFSLYAWNSLRSLYLAQEVKQRLPQLKIIVGGPEVIAKDTAYVLNNPAVDVGCIGEGEFTFAEIMQCILSGEDNYDNIEGIFYRKGRSAVITRPRKPAGHAGDLPSPYLSGVLDPSDYGCIWIETKRGCANQCTYCSERLRPPRLFSATRICRELQLALNKRLDVFFIESNFVGNPTFKDIFGYLKKNNRNRVIPYMLGEARAEELSRQTIDLLKSAGMSRVEVGLQSSNADTLSRIKRSTELNRFLQGIKLLKQGKIDVAVDIILGLPEDSLSSFKATLRFLKQHKLKSNAYLLKVEPGTELKGEAQRYRIKYQRRPPYRILKAPYLSGGDIQKAITAWQGRGVMSFPASLTGYTAYDYSPRKSKLHARPPEQERQLLNKLVLELGPSCRDPEKMSSAGAQVCRNISQPFTLWVKTESITRDLDLLKAFATPIAQANPFLLWNIVLETPQAFPASTIESVRKSICSREDAGDFYQSAHQFCAVLPWPGSKIEKRWLAQLSRTIPLYWSVEFSQNDNWRLGLKRLFRQKTGKGVVIDFDCSCRMDLIVKFCRALFQQAPGKQNWSISFRNYALQQMAPLFTAPGRLAGKEDKLPPVRESILMLDRHLDSFYVSRLDGETILQAIGWLSGLKSFFKDESALNRIERMVSAEIDSARRSGFYYEQIKEYKKAARLYKTLLGFSAENGAIHLALSRVCFKLNDYVQAIQAAQRAIALKHPQGNAHFLLGLCYQQTKRYRQAITALRQAAKISPHQPQINFSLADCYRKIGKRDKADREFRQGMFKFKQAQPGATLCSP